MKKNIQQYIPFCFPVLHTFVVLRPLDIMRVIIIIIKEGFFVKNVRCDVNCNNI